MKVRAKSAWILFERNRGHGSLRFKKLRVGDGLWSVRINEQYRAVGVRADDTIEWI